MPLPPGVEVRVVESTPNVWYYILPPKPAGDELSDEKLDQVVGGTCLLAYPTTATNVSDCTWNCSLREQHRRLFLMAGVVLVGPQSARGRRSHRPPSVFAYGG